MEFSGEIFGGIFLGEFFLGANFFGEEFFWEGNFFWGDFFWGRNFFGREFFLGGMVPRHVATCSGPARAAERALPCGPRVRVVHAPLHGSRILGSCSLAVTLIITKEVRVLPPLFLQHGSCQLIHCAVSVGFWCAHLVLEPCSSTSSCALSVLGAVSRTVVGGPTAEPRRSNARC